MGCACNPQASRLKCKRHWDEWIAKPWTTEESAELLMMARIAAVATSEKRALAEARLEPILAVLDHPLRCLLYHLLHASGIDLQTAERELRKQGWWLH